MTSPRRGFTILTWNIWFEELLQAERMANLLAFIEDRRPDIICLQEVTHDLLRYLLAPGTPLQRDFQRVPGDAALRSWYWECIYTRLPIGEQSGRHAYQQSEMGRGLTTLHCPEMDLAVGTTHLESMESASLRQIQARQAARLLKGCRAANNIFLGDMNLRNGETLDAVLPKRWKDLWPQHHGDDPGFTFDASQNPLAMRPGRFRFDRIYAQCRDYSVARMELIDLQLFASRNATMFPSDHFGLLAEFSPKSS